jgi:flavodoxin
MKALVVYDSFFGNTEKIAQAIGQALGAAGEVAVRRVSEVQPAQLTGVELLVVGSPTRAFRPSPLTTSLLNKLPAGSLQGVKVATFDTRVSTEDAKSAILGFMVNLFGYAAQPMAIKLRKRGGTPVGTPEGFFVRASEGPLKEGELERAAAWAKGLVATR